MTTLVLVLSLVVSGAVVATLAAVLVRPGVFDRIIGMGVVGSKTTVLLAFVGVLFERLDMFIDLAITYALLNFIVTLAVAKYFARAREAP